MDKQHINAKYDDLCKKYNIKIKIINIFNPDAPQHEIKEENNCVHLIVNDARISSEKYERYLAYYISNILLPRLVLSTDRLILRRFKPEDAASCFAFMSDVDGAYMDCSKAFTSMDDEYAERMELFSQREKQYVVVLKKSGNVIGTINVFEDNSRAVDTMEIGYSISPAYRRKGYAYEALSALLDLLQKDLLLDMVVAGILEENYISVRLLEKLGFQKEGTHHKAVWHEGLDKPVDLIYYYRDLEQLPIE